MNNLLLIFFAICFFSCRNKTTGNNLRLNNQSKNDSTIVIINQTGNKKEQFKYFDYFNDSQQVPFPGTDTLLINCKKTIVAYNSNSGDFSDLTYYTLSPSDTIIVKISKDKRLFFSKNLLLEKKIMLMSQLLFNVGSLNYSHNEDLSGSLRSINEYYINKKQIVEKNKNNIDNKTYIEANNIINYDKLAALLMMYTQFKLKNDTVLNSLVKIDSTAWNYLTFRNVINNYIVYINRVYQKNTLTTCTKFLKDQFPSSVRDYAIFFYLDNFKPENKNNLDTLNKLVTQFENFTKQRDILVYLKTNLEKYNETLQEQNSNVISLESIDNKRFSLEELLRLYKGKLVYLDFWASWCSPCLAEMNSSSQLSNLYKIKNSPVVFLYLSGDTNMALWKNKSKDLQIPSSHNFIILKNLEYQEFSKKYALKSIPRYMLIGKTGKMIDPDASRPSNPNLKLQINKLIN